MTKFKLHLCLWLDHYWKWIFPLYLTFLLLNALGKSREKWSNDNWWCFGWTNTFWPAKNDARSLLSCTQVGCRGRHSNPVLWVMLCILRCNVNILLLILLHDVAVIIFWLIYFWLCPQGRGNLQFPGSHPVSLNRFDLTIAVSMTIMYFYWFGHSFFKHYKLMVAFSDQ